MLLQGGSSVSSRKYMEHDCMDMDKEKILRFTDPCNPNAQPFLWTATADSILHKVQGPTRSRETD